MHYSVHAVLKGLGFLADAPGILLGQKASHQPLAMLVVLLRRQNLVDAMVAARHEQSLHPPIMPATIVDATAKSLARRRGRSVRHAARN